MSRSETFEAKARQAEKLALEFPSLQDVYRGLAAVWLRLARQAQYLNA